MKTYRLWFAGVMLIAGATPVMAQTLPVNLPRDLSPWAMFMAADMIVKAVMIGLVFASLVTWTIAVFKFLEIREAEKKARDTLHILDNQSSLDEARAVLSDDDRLGRLMLDAVQAEMRMSAGVDNKDGVKERVRSRLERIEAAASRSINRGTGVLATIGSTAPFVGLFGTVWGIMNSFIGISLAQTTNLAVVAPGIAEALLATAIGLVAAIPAVVVYNHFSRAVGVYRALIGDVSAKLMQIVSRDLDRMRKLSLRAAE